MKKNKGDESIGVIIYIYGNIKRKLPVSQTSKNVILFFLQNQRTGGQSRSCLGEGDWYQLGGGRLGRGEEGSYGAKNVCTCM
jgi:hypothetical protein